MWAKKSPPGAQVSKREGGGLFFFFWRQQARARCALSLALTLFFLILRHVAEASLPHTRPPVSPIPPMSHPPTPDEAAVGCLIEAVVTAAVGCSPSGAGGRAPEAAGAGGHPQDARALAALASTAAARLAALDQAGPEIDGGRPAGWGRRVSDPGGAWGVSEEDTERERERERETRASGA